MGSYLATPRDLDVENITILQESDLPDGRTLLEIAADISNIDIGVFAGVVVGAIQVGLEEQVAEALATVVQLGRLPADEVTAVVDRLHLVVDAADLVTARADIFAGNVIDVLATTTTGFVADKASGLALVGIQIVEEITLADGRILILFGADVHNQTGEGVEDLKLLLNPIAGSAASAEIANSALQFPTVGENEYLPAPGTFYLAVDDDALADFRTGVLTGHNLAVSGTELYVFSAPPRGIDRATEDAWNTPAQFNAQDEITLVFEVSTPFLESLQAGELLVEDPGIHRLDVPALQLPFGHPQPDPPKVLADFLPFEVIGVTPGDEESMIVVGRQRELIEVVKSATFFQDSRTSPYDQPVRDPYDPVVENTYTEEEQAERDELADIIREENPRDGRLADLGGMSGTPWHFNEVALSPKIRASGSLLLRSSGLQFEVKIRNFQLQRAIAHLDAGAVLNLVIECNGREETADLPEEEKSAALFDLVLPGVTFNIAGVPVQIAPVFYLNAGVEANIPQSLTLPLQSSFVVGMDMGFDRARMTSESDGFFYEPTNEFVPITVSDPTIFDEAAASVGVWAELGAGIIGSIAPVGIGQRGVLNLGPSMSVRASAEFTVAPFLNPWWNLDFDIDLTGHFAMDFLGQTLIDGDIPILNFELEEFDRDAGGPLIPPGGMAAVQSPVNAGIRPLSAETVRWGRLFHPEGQSGSLHEGFLFRPEIDDEVIVGYRIRTGTSFLTKLNSLGDVLWSRDLGFALPERGAELSAGHTLTAGFKGSEIVLCEFDPDGNRLWARSYAPETTSFSVTDAAVERDGAGEPTAIFLAGNASRLLSVRESDPYVAKFDPTGNLLWSFTYELPEDDEVNGMILAADGDLILAGRTDANVAAPGEGTPDSSNIIKDATSNGLLMKVGASDGSLVWAHAYASTRGMIFEDVVEGPDGRFYAGGASTRTVAMSRPVTLFAKFESDGTLFHHVLVGDDPDLTDELPDGGNTPYDTVSRMAWYGDGFVACGTTGLGVDRAGWTMALTDELGVKFFSAFDGVAGESFVDLAAGPNGITVLGSTESFLPWASSGTGRTVLLQLPWEGIMRFHEDTSAKSLFLRPQVFLSSSDLEFQMSSSVEIPGASRQTFTNLQSPVTFGKIPFAFSPGGTIREPIVVPATELVAIEKIERGVIGSFEEWARYHNLTGADAEPEANGDADDYANIFEAYFGLSPHRLDHGSVVSMSEMEYNGEPAFLVEFDRASYAGSFGARVELSEDLAQWYEPASLTEFVEPASSAIEHARLLIPMDVPRRFLRFAFDAGE